MPESTQPRLSIVTVVKDDVAGFDRTARSIADQDVTRMEWIIIDSSSDRSAIPRAIPPGLRDIALYAWTEPLGVYPAMNAGLGRVRGDYVLFLNAGDEVASAGTLPAILEAIAGDPVWAYGQVTFVGEDGHEVTPSPFDYTREKAALFSRGRFPSHQGTIARTHVLRAMGGFDTSYRITADYAVALRLSREADPVEIPEVIAVFHEGGVSTTAWRASLSEFHRARRDILRPSGLDWVREYVESGAQWSRMSLARAWAGRRR